MNKKLISVELSNRKGLYHELDLPASTYEMLDAMERLRMEPTDDPAWEICTYYDKSLWSLGPYLRDGCRLTELNVLMARLAELDEHGRTAFGGLFEREYQKKNGPIYISQIIDFAYNTDCCHVVPEVRNDDQLGRFYAETGFMPELDSLPDNIYEMLDFARIGRDRRRHECGTLTEKGYVIPHAELKPVYKGMDFTLKKPDYLFQLTLDNYPYDPVNHVCMNVPLELPATERQMQAALEQLGPPNWDEVVIVDYDAAVPALVDGTCDLEGIDEINELSKKLQRLDKTGKLPMYKALLEASKCTELKKASKLVEQLNQYTFDPQIARYEDVAKESLSISLGESEAEVLMPYVQMEAYGMRLLRDHKMELTGYGLVSRKDGGTIQAVDEQKRSINQDVEALMKASNVDIGYVYRNQNREKCIFLHSPENIANFLGQYPDADRIIITDVMDLLLVESYGWYINHCPDETLLEQVKRNLIPIQMGEAKPGELFSVTEEEYQRYQRGKDMEEMQM